jgi:hypothetical protein
MWRSVSVPNVEGSLTVKAWKQRDTLPLKTAVVEMS